MELLKTREQLRKNILTFDNYLQKGTLEQKEWAKERIFEGICFIAYSMDNNIRFIPSRFLGYVDNELEKHNLSTTKHGRDSNRAINKILGCKPELNEKLLNIYLDFCGRIGVEKRDYGSRGFARKFWGEILQVTPGCQSPYATLWQFISKH